MRHPTNRAERRHNGDTWRNRNRFRMTNIWTTPRIFGEAPGGGEGYWEDNLMWWARKQMQCHSDCCNVWKKSTKEIRKRRNGDFWKDLRRPVRLYGEVSLSSLSQDFGTEQQKGLDKVLLRRYRKDRSYSEG